MEQPWETERRLRVQPRGISFSNGGHMGHMHVSAFNCELFTVGAPLNRIVNVGAQFTIVRDLLRDSDAASGVTLVADAFEATPSFENLPLVLANETFFSVSCKSMGDDTSIFKIADCKGLVAVALVTRGCRSDTFDPWSKPADDSPGAEEQRTAMRSVKEFISFQLGAKVAQRLDTLDLLPDPHARAFLLRDVDEHEREAVTGALQRLGAGYLNRRRR